MDYRLSSHINFCQPGKQTGFFLETSTSVCLARQKLKAINRYQGQVM